MHQLILTLASWSDQESSTGMFSPVTSEFLQVDQQEEKETVKAVWPQLPAAVPSEN